RQELRPEDLVGPQGRGQEDLPFPFLLLLDEQADAAGQPREEEDSGGQAEDDLEQIEAQTEGDREEDEEDHGDPDGIPELPGGAGMQLLPEDRLGLPHAAAVAEEADPANLLGSEPLVEAIHRAE